MSNVWPKNDDSILVEENSTWKKIVTKDSEEDESKPTKKN